MTNNYIKVHAYTPTLSPSLSHTSYPWTVFSKYLHQVCSSSATHKIAFDATHPSRLWVFGKHRLPIHRAFTFPLLFSPPHTSLLLTEEKKRVKWSCCVIGHRLSVSLALVVSPRATGAICKHVVYVRTVSLTKIGLKRCIQRHESWRRGLSQAMCNLIFVQFQISTGRTLDSEVADVEATVFFPSCPQVNE